MPAAATTISVPTARDSALSSPPSDVTLMTSCMSPWPNLSTSNWAALADSDVGSWNPPADRLLVTGMPKMPAATITSSAMTMIRLGALIAIRAIRCSTSYPLRHQSSSELSAVSYQR